MSEHREKKPKLGSGERFARLESRLKRQGVRDPAALAASIGRKKLGKERFQELSAAGRRRKKKRGGSSHRHNSSHRPSPLAMALSLRNK